MSSDVALPLWLFSLLLVFAAIGLWLGWLAPLMSRLFYRRRQRTARRLDQKLEFGLAGYSLAGRKEWLDRLLNDPVVLAAIETAASENDQPLEDVKSRARSDAQEIVPFFNVLFYFRIGYWVGRWVLRMMYHIRTAYHDNGGLESIEKDSCVVLVSNHRSNLDPFMMIYLASRRSAVSYSAGEWARAWPFRYLLHALGFYIVRRDGGGDRLYRTLVERYVFLAASHCVPQGLFLEGALSRDGKMQPMKLGLLSYILKAQGQGRCRDIVFVPVGINYDRIPEDKTLIQNQEQGFRDKGRFYASLSFLRFAVLMMPRMIGLTKPYGQVVANYGEPLSLSSWQKATGTDFAQLGPEQRRNRVSALGETLKQTLEELIPVLPISLLAEVLSAQGEGISEFQLKSSAMALAAKLRQSGVAVSLNDETAEREFSEALYLLFKRGYVRLGADQQVRSTPGGEAMLAYYRGVISATCI